MASEDPFSPLKEQLNKFFPSFAVDPSQIQILRHPSDFYKNLTCKITSAKARVFISTLYIGNRENELVSNWLEAPCFNFQKICMLIFRSRYGRFGNLFKEIHS
jgi:hypothetical protein